jgi:hypothetical protein
MNINRQAMTDQVEQTHALAARTASERIGSFLASRLVLANGLATNPAILSPKSPEARVLLSQNLQAWAPLGVQAIALVTPLGEEVIRAQLSGTDVKDRLESVLSAEPGEDVSAFFDQVPPLLRFQAELPQQIGYIWLVAESTPIGEEALDSYELGENAHLVVADNERRLLTGTTDTIKGFPESAIQEALSSWVVGVKPSFKDPLSGEEVIVAYAPVPHASWIVLSRQPLQVAHQVANRMKRQAGIALAGSLLIIGLVTVGAYVTVVRPIRRLAQAQRSLAGVSHRASGNEIDQLKQSFDVLRQRINEQEALDEIFLGRYKVVKVVGSGAMGTVFRAWDPRLERPIALKTIRLDTSDSARREELVSSLLKEAITVARFNHPNIVSVFDVEDQPEGAYVAMEYVDGYSLERLLWQIPQLEADQVIALGAEIARGLEAAHERDIIHRDIKPANILLGHDDSVKVTDFGISDLMSAVTQGDDDSIFGTPGFMPPEVLYGGEYSKAGDLFSLVVTLYVCLTGIRPFEGSSLKEIIRRTLFSKVTPPIEVRPQTSPELNRLIMSLLEKKSVKRISSASLVVEILDEWVTEKNYAWKLPILDDLLDSNEGAKNPTQWIPTRRIQKETKPID